ncbi:MGMT family protein [Parabacteroides sp. PF5-9]|uniref:MGMT family protein n=1 Tax=Parabacteroides sp. PF5-9 TaxID=1742404 RepID=UPI0024761B52|nr:MGMT family protein [Parabacteroides sp. PF5-9]MDH6357522.1 methylated-DNA-protein-cysteine methyltransferase-like protein [Parabacteroides sp. PF5-9]
MDQKERKRLVQAIYEIVETIPQGRATSYGAIAKAIGYPNLSRLVGKIMSECDSKVNHIPAHRVVNSQGVLSAKDAFGPGCEMQKLLEAEGVEVVNDRIKNWKKIFWNPLHEISFND